MFFTDLGDKSDGGFPGFIKGFLCDASWCVQQNVDVHTTALGHTEGSAKIIVFILYTHAHTHKAPFVLLQLTLYNKVNTLKMSCCLCCNTIDMLVLPTLPFGLWWDYIHDSCKWPCHSLCHIAGWVKGIWACRSAQKYHTWMFYWLNCSGTALMPSLVLKMNPLFT